MPCYTVDANTGELFRGIEFRESDHRGKYVEIIIRDGVRRVCLCPVNPPKRTTALTMNCGKLEGGLIVSCGKNGNIALVQIHSSHKVTTKSPLVIIMGDEKALVQLVPGTSCTVHNSTKKLELTFQNGQLLVEPIVEVETSQVK